MRPLRTVITIAPPVILLIWGGSYVRDAARLLLAPGVPLKLRYASPGGTVEFWADGYRVDLSRRQVSAWGLYANDPLGKRIVSLNRVDVSGLEPLSLRPVVRLDGIDARIERDASGLSFTRFLPKQEGPPSTTPFSVTVRNARLVYVDRTFQKPVTQVAKSERITMDGVGDDWHAEGSILLPNLGRAQVTATSVANRGVRLDLNSSRLDLKPLLPLITTEVQVGALIAKGPVRIEVPINGKGKANASLYVEAANVRYRDVTVENAVFRGRASDEGAEGTLRARAGGVEAEFIGNATPKAVAGKIRGTVISLASLPQSLRAQIPSDLTLRNGKYDGWFAWNEGRSPETQGIFSSETIRYGPDTLTSVSGELAYDGKAIDVRRLNTRWNDARLLGDAHYDLKTRSIRAAVLTPKVSVGRLATRFGSLRGLDGILSGTAFVSGTAKRPVIEGQVSGALSLNGQKLGQVDGRGAWLAGAARIDRLRLSGPLGAVVAGGTLNQYGALKLTAQARGIHLDRLNPELKGLVSAKLEVGGTLRNPRATGRAEAYRLAYGEETLPAAGFDLVATRQQLQISGIEAIRGTARLRGRLTASLTGRGVELVDPNTWPLNGRLSLTGIQLNEIPGAENLDDLAGLVSITGAQLSGRLGDPVLTAGIEGDGLIVNGIRIESLRAEARVTRREATLTDAEAALASGSITGSGTYDIQAKRGSANFEASNLQLSRLLNDLSDEVVVDGTLNASAVDIQFEKGNITAKASGGLSGVKLNGVLAGDGNWNVSLAENRINADASIGRLDPTLRAVDAVFAYDLKSGGLNGEVSAKDLPISAIATAAIAKDGVGETQSTLLSKIVGDITGSATFTRMPDQEFELSARALSASGLKYQDQAYGTFTIDSLTRRGGDWALGTARLDGPVGSVALTGTYKGDGILTAKATASNLKVSGFSSFAPALAQVPGELNFELNAQGTAKSPKVTGSAALFTGSAESPDQRLALELNNILLQSGESSVDGILKIGDKFGGLLSGRFDWQMDQPIDSAQFGATLKLGKTVFDTSDPNRVVSVAPVPLSEIPGLNTYLDPARGDGTLAGEFNVTGSLARAAGSDALNDYRITGGLNLEAPRLGVRLPEKPGSLIAKIDDGFRDVKGSLRFLENNRPELSLSLNSERGGSLNLSAGLVDPGNLAPGETPLSIALRSWRLAPITGQVDVKNLALRQGFAGAQTSADVEGALSISGTAASPLITGAFELASFETTFPTLDGAEATASVPLVDPRFDVRVLLAKGGKPDVGRFRTATADLYLVGDAAISGTLSNPKADANFVTDHGSIRLPGGLIRVDKGGLISFTYKNPLSGGPPAVADLDLQGRSQVTLARTGQGSQRYDITLDVRGDLLSENGLKFDATSDPPDLSKDEILAALGQKDLLESFSQGGSDTERRLRSALVGFAIPSLLDSFTGGLAQKVGLDYVSLEYNEYDQATIAFAESLGPFFSFQGRQQVGTPTPGFRSIYDLRLTFNPRGILPKLSRFSLSLGTDQDRPWKASIEYGTRFGQRGGKSGERTVLFPAMKKKDVKP